MVTNPIEITPPTKMDTAKSAARLVIAGSSVGAVRRILLYIVVALVIPLPVDPVGAIGLAALLLLALTDDLR